MSQKGGYMATQEQGAEMLSRKDMTEILPGSAGFEMQGGASYPQVIPNSPTFHVPANPLLPQDYNEVLDYNAVQYLNGIFRTRSDDMSRYHSLWDPIPWKSLKDT